MRMGSCVSVSDDVIASAVIGQITQFEGKSLMDCILLLTFASFPPTFLNGLFYVCHCWTTQPQILAHQTLFVLCCEFIMGQNGD